MIQRPYTQQHYRIGTNNYGSNQYKTKRFMSQQQQQQQQFQNQNQTKNNINSIGIRNTKTFQSQNNNNNNKRQQHTVKPTFKKLNTTTKTLIRQKSKFKKSVISKKVLKNDCFFNCCNFLNHNQNTVGNKNESKFKFLKQCSCGTGSMKPDSYYEVSFKKQDDDDTNLPINDQKLYQEQQQQQELIVPVTG
jgi:hypothetical protein